MQSDGTAARRRLPSAVAVGAAAVVVGAVAAVAVLGVPAVDTSTAAASIASAADTTCPCENGTPAARDETTGAPCAAAGSQYCSACDEANNYFDFEQDGTCKLRPACVCPHGVAAARQADCSVGVWSIRAFGGEAGGLLGIRILVSSREANTNVVT